MDFIFSWNPETILSLVAGFASSQKLDILSYLYMFIHARPTNRVVLCGILHRAHSENDPRF